MLATRIEHPLPSGDVVDLLIETRNRLIAVEVKGVSAPSGEILRGLFQCIKYDALARAVMRTEGRYVKCSVILALGGPLPPDLVAAKNTLAVDVRESLDEAISG